MTTAWVSGGGSAQVDTTLLLIADGKPEAVRFDRLAAIVLGRKLATGAVAGGP
jgi:hypothetical protein